MRLSLAADHAGLSLKEDLRMRLLQMGHDVIDFGAYQLDQGDDYPDFVVPMALCVASGSVDRGIAVCGSGVGAAICANKVPGIRAALIHDEFSVRQGVEVDHINVLCIDGQIMGSAVAWEIVQTFLAARFRQTDRCLRRLAKVASLEAGRATFQWT